MMSASDESQTGPVSDRDVFVQQLPKRLDAIEAIWSGLENGDWDRDQLQAFDQRVREISESSKTHGLFQLNESAFSLEVYLSSFIESEAVPSADQISEISGLVRSARTAAQTTLAAEQEPQPAPGEVTVCVLGAKGGLTAEIGESLRRLDANVSYFDDVDPLLNQLQARPPKAIVADTSMLSVMGPVSAELTRLRSHVSVHVPLVFVGENSTLQVRVDAIRAGSDGFFVAPLDADAVAVQIREMALPEQQAAIRVVVVEDDPTQAEFAASILHKSGIEVLQVTDPNGLIEKLRDFKPDLILMDIYMPEVNGIELTTVIRDYPEFVAIPIVFLSGEQNADKQLDALSVGGDDFIAKPIRPKHLLGIVETRVQRSRQLRQATGQPPKHDRVSGLFSRQYYLHQIANAIEQGLSGGSMAALVIQPDNIEDIRRKTGVGGLDHVIAELGTLVEGLRQDTDLAARIDDHTLGLLARRGHNDDLVAIGNALLEHVVGHRFTERIEITVSVGICFIEPSVEEASGVLKRATSACENAASHGGNRVNVHHEDSASEEIALAPESDFAQRVKSALLNNDFVVQYQPMLDLQERGSETYEIITRVANAQGDLIGGRSLIEAAEGIDACIELDDWALDRAIDILKQRRESGRRTRIFVHLSGRSAMDPEMPTRLASRLRQKQVVGTGLVLDFCLPEISQDLRIAKQNVSRLHEMDVEISLSRFPEKDAAFKVLRFLHAGFISIAQRLLKADRDVISDVIRQAHAASSKVIVSNIDDPRSIDLHWSSGADFLQGNFIQRPLENMEYDFSQVVI